MRLKDLNPHRLADQELADLIEIVDRYLTHCALRDGEIVRGPVPTTPEGIDLRLQTAHDAAVAGVRVLQHLDAKLQTSGELASNPQIVAQTVAHTLECSRPDTCPAIAVNKFGYMLVRTIAEGNAEQRRQLSTAYPFHVMLTDIYEQGDDGREYVHEIGKNGPPE